MELSKDLERIGGRAFGDCRRLRHIAFPLKDNLLENNSVFMGCDDLSQIDLVGRIHKTISSLPLESWRHEMNDETDRINRDLPNIHYDKTFVIRRWMERVLERIEHYKSQHYALLKNNMTQLELALWKSNLLNIEAAASRDEARVTCGANIIIPHVLPFLKMKKFSLQFGMFHCRMILARNEKEMASWVRLSDKTRLGGLNSKT